MIEDALAQAAVRRSVAGMEAIERAANKAAQAIQKAHSGGGGGGGGAPGGGGGGGGAGGGGGGGGAGGGGAGSSQARAAADLDALQDRLILKDYNRRVRYEAQQISSAERAAAGIANAKAREAAQLEKIQDRYIKRDYDQRVAYEQKKIAAAEQAAAKQAQFVERQSKQLMIAAGVGLTVLTEGYDKIRSDAEAAAKATLELKKNLRVEATLTGKEPDAALREHIQFRAETGLGQAEASEFIKQFEGTTPIGLEKYALSGGKEGISPEIAQELRRAAGGRAARIGGEAGTHAELAGILGQFQAVPSAKAGLSQLEAIRVGLVKGRGDDSPLTRQLLNVSGSLVGEGHAVPSLPEMAALIGVTSLSGGPQQAGDRANQLYRGLKIGLSKQTKVRGTDQAQGAYLKGLGVGEKDTLEQTLDKIVPDLQRAKDSGRDLDAYLTSKNFRASEQRRAIIETFENYAPLKTRMKEAREAGLGEGLGAGEIEKNRQFIEGPQGRDAVKDAMKTAAEVTRGAPGERLEALRGLIESSPEVRKADESSMTQVTDFLRGALRSPLSVLGGGAAKAGRDIRVGGEIARNLRERAMAVGVPEEEISRIDPTIAGLRQPQGPLAMQDFVNKMESMISARGGSLAADTVPILKEMNGSLKKMADMFEGKGKAPAPLPVKPPQAEAGR